MNAPDTAAKPEYGRLALWLKRLRLKRNGDVSLRESLEEVIGEHAQEPGEMDMGAEERSMLMNILSYGELRIQDIMVPRADIIAFDADDGFEALISAFSEAAHSRLPIYRETLDDVIGMAHVKDVLRAIAAHQEGDATPAIRDILRPVLFVAPSMKVIDLLARMRQSRTHMAIVVDEYGGSDGLVTIEDVVEQIVGDIEDEHDEDQPPALSRLDDRSYQADARLPIEELEEVLGCDLLADERDEDLDTVGGLVVSLEGRVPAVGESLVHPLGFRFEVVDGDPRRIKTVRVYHETVDDPADDRA